MRAQLLVDGSRRSPWRATSEEEGCESGIAESWMSDNRHSSSVKTMRTGGEARRRSADNPNDELELGGV